jgi:hypothetical protein
MLTLASMVVSRLVFQHAGWGVAASVTPAVMGLAGEALHISTAAAACTWSVGHYYCPAAEWILGICVWRNVAVADATCCSM